jgi:TetR/AcrR family tetracycline transcriptional repressor
VTEESEETGKQRGTGKSLDRDMVVRAALRSIDRSGAQGLTMRGLGQELGVQAMSLYRYVSGREDVLEAVVTLLLDGLPGRLDKRVSRTWQGYLQAMAHTIREIALQHPRAFPLVATRHPAAPWLRPPLRSLEVVEDFLATLGGFGFTDDQLVDTYRSFSSLLLGHLLLESAIHGAETSPVEEPLDEGDAQIPNQDGRIDLPSTSEVIRLRDRLSEDRGTDEFEASLESLLDRIELQISQ